MPEWQTKKALSRLLQAAGGLSWGKHHRFDAIEQVDHSLALDSTVAAVHTGHKPLSTFGHIAAVATQLPADTAAAARDLETAMAGRLAELGG